MYRQKPICHYFQQEEKNTLFFVFAFIVSVLYNYLKIIQYNIWVCESSSTVYLNIQLDIHAGNFTVTVFVLKSYFDTSLGLHHT